MKQILIPPIYVGAAAVYPYSDALMEQCAKLTRYGDEYSLARVIGVGEARRILVPRNMASSIPKDMRVSGTWYEFTSNFIPRNSEQERIIKETVEWLKLGANFLTEAPTGFGKTYCAMDIIAKVGKKTLVVVTKEDIRDQWIEAAEKVLGLKQGKGIGLVQGDICQTTGQGVVIAMIQSLAKDGRYPEYAFNDFGLVIWDEAHRMGADHFSQSCYRVPAKLRLGISATPDRKDGKVKVIEAHIGKVKVVTTLAPMTPKVIVRKSPWQIPLRREKQPDGSWVMKQIKHSPAACGHVINMMVKDHNRNVMLVKFIVSAYQKGRKILVQSDRKDHLEHLFSLVSKSSVPTPEMGYYATGLTKEQREVVKTKRVIFATYQMTAEATDIPTLDTLVMGTPKSDVRQVVGRILRTSPDKKQPIVFDMQDDSSSVFSGYSKSREKWYATVNAQIERIT